jgi:ABC-type Fe3+-hydroxamate transport system substrate-binding protein
MKRILLRSVACSGLLMCIYIASTSDAAGQSGYPQMFTDATGRSITLTAKPTRIASVVLGVDENLLDLVDPSRIVTMTGLSRDPGISNVAGRVPAGMTVISDRWQPVVDANPDLVLVASLYARTCHTAYRTVTSRLSILGVQECRCPALKL